MNWIIVAISAHLFWALVNIGDKYVVGSRVKNPYIYIIWLTLLSLLVVMIIPFIDFVIPTMFIFWWLMLASMTHLYGGLFYIKAAKIEDISRINIWWGLIPVFSLIIAWFALGENLNFNQLISFIILVISGVLASIHIGKFKITFSKALGLMIASTLLFAIYAVVFRYITTMAMNFISAFVWLHILTAIWAVPLFLIKKFRQDFISETKNIKSGYLLWIVLIIAVLDSLGILFNFKALSLGPVALVFAMESFQAIFVFIIVMLLTWLAPKIIKEKFDFKNGLLKAVALILMVVGIVILNLN